MKKIICLMALTSFLLSGCAVSENESQISSVLSSAPDIIDTETSSNKAESDNSVTSGNISSEVQSHSSDKRPSNVSEQTDLELEFRTFESFGLTVEAIDSRSFLFCGGSEAGVKSIEILGSNEDVEFTVEKAQNGYPVENPLIILHVIDPPGGFEPLANLNYVNIMFNMKITTTSGVFASNYIVMVMVQ